MESIEISAKTVEEAVILALQRLGRKKDEVDIVVLREGSRGILGIGAEDALVRVSVRPQGAAPPPVQPAPPTPSPRARAAPPTTSGSPRTSGLARPTHRPERGAVRPAPRPTKGRPSPRPGAPTLETIPPPTPAGPPPEPGTDEEIMYIARQVVSELLRLMGFAAAVSIRDNRVLPAEEGAPPTVIVDVEGQDLGMLIGRRGEVLSALQFITNLIVGRRIDHRARVIVDVEHYWQRREANLRSLARRMADRVRTSHRPLSLEPMPAHERRIIHLTLASDPDVTTQSTGEGDNRKVVIMPRPPA